MRLDALKTGLQFQTLAAHEKAFLWVLRNHVRQENAVSKDAISNDCPKTVLFIAAFASGLSEPLVIAPTRCSCPIRFHEQTLIGLLRAQNDLPAFTSALKDLMLADNIEALWRFVHPVKEELSDWLMLSGIHG